jgi:hypothetical protein
MKKSEACLLWRNNMKELKDYIDAIIDIEWKMFDKVQNASGRAACQDDFFTFNIMRRSQFESWNERLCASYLFDLENALKEGRNLLTEKYARMMKYTAPLEFEKIKDRLPQLPEENQILAKCITEKNLKYYEKLRETYPRVCRKGRPAIQEQDNRTSIEAYMMGELLTYSLQTLKLYEEYMNNLHIFGENIPKRTLERTAQMYGYHSLDHAEQALAGAGH